MTTPSAVDVALVRRLVEDLGGSATRIEDLGGVVNHVLRVRGATTDWVVRLPVDPREPDQYPVEGWMMARAREVGVPTPVLVDSGLVQGRPYQVCEHVAAVPLPDGSHWCWLGRYAARLAGIGLSGAPEALFTRFGRDLAHAWQQHLAYNLAELGERDLLLRDGVYHRADLARLRALLTGLAGTGPRFGLAHGDLAPRNLVPRGAESPPVLIDWGNASTGPAPWTDLELVHRWVQEGTVTAAELDQMVRAAGVEPGRRTTQRLRAMSVLHHLDVARWALDRRPGLYPRYRDSGRRGIRRLLDV